MRGPVPFRLDEGKSLTPGIELGIRRDGGDTETGTGFEVGAGFTYVNIQTGLDVEVRARTLISHDDDDYEEWGASASVKVDPGSSGRGLSFTLAPTIGKASSGISRLWNAQDMAKGEFRPERKLDAEIGYGIALGNSFTGHTYTRLGLSEDHDYRVGWRLQRDGSGDLELGIEGILNDTETGVQVSGGLHW